MIAAVLSLQPMRVVDKIRFGPFSTAYHSSLVDDAFKTALSAFLESDLIPQLDEPATDAEGTLIATFDKEQHCGPNSLVRDIFTLELTLYSDNGTSELKSDVTFNATNKSFSPRTGYDHYFYLWTPARKEHREREMAAIHRLVDDIKLGRSNRECPICHEPVSAINNPEIFDVRCRGDRCFQYNFHKDEHGRLAHGHFFTKHPAKRTEPSDAL